MRHFRAWSFPELQKPRDGLSGLCEVFGLSGLQALSGVLDSLYPCEQHITRERVSVVVNLGVEALVKVAMVSAVVVVAVAIGPVVGEDAIVVRVVDEVKSRLQVVVMA